jgi:hypothetical protein
MQNIFEIIERQAETIKTQENEIKKLCGLLLQHMTIGELENAMRDDKEGANNGYY